MLTVWTETGRQTPNLSNHKLVMRQEESPHAGSVSLLLDKVHGGQTLKNQKVQHNFISH